MIDFSTWIADCGSHRPAFVYFLISSDPSMCSTVGFLSLEKSDVVVSVSIGFSSNSKGNVSSHCLAYDYYYADCASLCNHTRGVQWEDSFKFGASAAAFEFFEWI